MIKLLCLSLFLLGIFAGAASGHGHWNSESSQDWLGVGPIYPYGPYYYPVYYENPIYYDTMYYWGWEDYPIYHSVYYPIYSTYYPPYYYPRYYNDFDSFRLGTFGRLHGGNY